MRSPPRSCRRHPADPRTGLRFPVCLVTGLPSAVTRSADSRLSAADPWPAIGQPIPPPISPANRSLAPRPCGRETEFLRVRRRIRPMSAPGSARAVCARGSLERFSWARSIIIPPSQTAFPTGPPPRTDSSKPRSRAGLTAPDVGGTGTARRQRRAFVDHCIPMNCVLSVAVVPRPKACRGDDWRSARSLSPRKACSRFRAACRWCHCCLRGLIRLKPSRNCHSTARSKSVGKIIFQLVAMVEFT